MNRNQKEVLNLLVDKYEKSKTYKGENIRKQSFTVQPEKIYPDYNGDFADVDYVKQFNRDMNNLEEYNLVKLDFRFDDVIANISINVEMLSHVYELLKRQDITEIRNAQIEMYGKYKGIHPIMDAFCDEQIERLCNYKNAEYGVDVSENILKLLQYILFNTKDIMERELSVAVLGDTKLFKSSYMNRICKVIERYSSFGVFLDILDEKEKKKVILEEYHVFSSPSYVFFKGDVKIRYNDGTTVAVKPDNPIAISSEVIEQIEEVNIGANRIITIENLTSYNRVKNNDSVLLFLSGYHNTAKQKFLMKIASDNRNVNWYHFGDIDPDGYYILKNLIEKTHIPFQPINMGIEYLKKYRKYCKKLEKNDIKKATSLIDCRFYEDVMQYMLKNDCKLEQEIISWLENESA